MPAPHSPSIDPALEHALADVFNHQYQSHREGVAWPIVMRSVARAIAETIHPDSAELRASFLDSANLSGLFIDREPCCAHCSSLESAARQTLAAEGNIPAVDRCLGCGLPWITGREVIA